MALEIFLSFLITDLILSFSSGPSVCFTIASGLKHGFVRTIPSIVGQLAANSLQIFLVFAGLNTLLEQSIELFFILKIIGAVYT